MFLKSCYAEFQAHQLMFKAMSTDMVLQADVERVVADSVQALRAGGKILIAGNGGSAADAQHWAGELVSRFNFDRPGLASIALTTDSSILTAIGNDYGYDYVFARQIEALARPGDRFWALSTSGNSPNILRAIQTAQNQGVGVVGFTGKNGGKMAPGCEVCFRIPSTHTPRIQEGHEFLGHLLCGLIEQGMFDKGSVNV